MIHRMGTIALAGMLIAGTATGLAAADRSARFSRGPAEADDLRGTIANIDPMAHTITFTDGRIVHYEPLWRILVNGNEVAVTDVLPSTVIAMAPAGTTTARVVTPGTPQLAAAQVPAAPGAVTYPPIVASGRATRVDPAARTITFEDGRTVTVTDGQVWQAMPLDRILPGTQVTVTGAQTTAAPGAMTHPPIMASGTATRVDSAARTIAFEGGRTVTVADGQVWQAIPLDRVLPGNQVTVTTGVPAGMVRESRAAVASPVAVSPGWVWMDRDISGRVVVVEPRGSQIVLADGTTMLVMPSTSGQTLSAQNITVNELRAGDQVVVQVQQVVPVIDYDSDATWSRRARVETRTSRTVRTDVPSPYAARTEVTPAATVETRVTTTDREVVSAPRFYGFPHIARVAGDRVVLVRRTQAP